MVRKSPTCGGSDSADWANAGETASMPPAVARPCNTARLFMLAAAQQAQSAIGVALISSAIETASLVFLVQCDDRASAVHRQPRRERRGPDPSTRGQRKPSLIWLSAARS